MSQLKYIDRVNEAASFIKLNHFEKIDLAVVLGTGLAGFEKMLENVVEIPYSKIPHFPKSTAPSHRGNIIIGKLGDNRILCFSGRLHWYEGYTMQEVTFPIRVAGVLGVKKLIVTNASGGLTAEIEGGDFVFIRDHINLFPDNPLRGPNYDIWGDRFPDMSQVYSLTALNIARDVCNKLNIPFKQGVYCGFPGPNLETPSEYQFLHRIGGDMVGMSTVPEVIVARHMKIGVCGISLVTNACYPPERIQETTVEDVLSMANSKQPIFQNLLSQMIQLWI